MVNEHDGKVFALGVHIQSSVYWVEIEAALDYVNPFDVTRNRHPQSPVYSKDEEEEKEDKSDLKM